MSQNQSKDVIFGAIEKTQEMLAKLKEGLIAGDPLPEMEQLAKDSSLLALSIEALVSARHDQMKTRPV